MAAVSVAQVFCTVTTPDIEKHIVGKSVLCVGQRPLQFCRQRPLRLHWRGARRPSVTRNPFVFR